MEQLLLSMEGAINESLHPPLDNRVRDARQYISDHLVTAISILPASPSMCAFVAVAPCRPVPRQAPISVLGWRSDQRISRAVAVEHHADADHTVGRNVGFEDQLLLFARN